MRGPLFQMEVTKMKIFHSELTAKVVLKYRQLQPHRKIRALISYAYRTKHHRDLLFGHRQMTDELIMDSGTFTLHSNRKKYQNSVTFDGYKSYMRQFAGKVDFYFNFDEDFSTDGFDINFRYQLELEKAGLKPVPVVHDCYGHEIQTYIDRGHDLVAIGSGELRRAGLDQLRDIVDGLYRKGVKVHFLGCTEYQKLAYLPVYSADSTTWNRTGALGRIFYWNPERVGYKKLDKISLDEKTPKRHVRHHIRDYPFRKRLEEYLYQELKLSIDDLLGKDRYLNRSIVNLHYFVLLEELIRRKHMEQGFSFR